MCFVDARKGEAQDAAEVRIVRKRGRRGALTGFDTSQRCVMNRAVRKGNWMYPP